MSPEAWAATEYTIAVWPTISINCSPVTAHILTDLCDHCTAQKGPSLVQNILAVGYLTFTFLIEVSITQILKKTSLKKVCTHLEWTVKRKLPIMRGRQNTNVGHQCQTAHRICGATCKFRSLFKPLENAPTLSNLFMKLPWHNPHRKQMKGDIQKFRACWHKQQENLNSLGQFLSKASDFLLLDWNAEVEKGKQGHTRVSRESMHTCCPFPKLQGGITWACPKSTPPISYLQCSISITTNYQEPDHSLVASPWVSLADP